MVYHIVSGDKIMVDFITRATMGKPGMLGCRPIERTYEFKWGYSFKDRMEFENGPMFKDVKQTLEAQNINFEVVNITYDEVIEKTDAL